jgi:hypothetical protein
VNATNTRSTPEGMTLEQVGAAIRQLVAEGNFNHHRIGVLYNYVVDNELAEQKGYKDAPAYFREHVKQLSRQTLVLYGSVARAFSATDCLNYGVSALSLLNTYKELAGISLHPADPGLTPIEVPDDQNVVVTKNFGDCTVEELRKALQRKRKPTSSQPIPERDLARAQQYRSVLTKAFPAETGVRLAVRNSKGKTVVTFKDVPLEDVELMVEALMDGLQPVQAVA